jgi:endonuclease I
MDEDDRFLLIRSEDLATMLFALDNLELDGGRLRRVAAGARQVSRSCSRRSFSGRMSLFLWPIRRSWLPLTTPRWRSGWLSGFSASRSATCRRTSAAMTAIRAPHLPRSGRGPFLPPGQPWDRRALQPQFGTGRSGMSDQMDLASAGADAEMSAERGLQRLEQNQGRTYYDATADAAMRDAYYVPINFDASPAEVFTQLSTLLTVSHDRLLSYRPAEELYPWVDLHPDGLLHHIYSGRAVEPAEVIKDDADRARQRAGRLRQILHQNPNLPPAEREAASQAIGQELRFNCEHVVPQSWFGRGQPMRGDLHHLFTCEPHCNSRRGSSTYADLSDTLQRMAECGRSSVEGFEPHEGKGAVPGPLSTSCSATQARSGTQPWRCSKRP